MQFSAFPYSKTWFQILSLPYWRIQFDILHKLTHRNIAAISKISVCYGSPGPVECRYLTSMQFFVLFYFSCPAFVENHVQKSRLRNVKQTWKIILVWQVVKGFMDKLEQVSENPELKEEMESEVTRYGFKKCYQK